MDKETFRKTERKLYNYYGKEKILSSYKRKIDLLNKHIKEIDNKVKNLDIDIPIESKSISFDEKVQSSNDGSSYAEIMLVKITEDLLKEKAYKLSQINEFEIRIRKIEADNIIIEENIDTLNSELKEFIELKYKEKKSHKQISFAMNMSESTVTRKKELALKVVDSWEEILMYCANV